MVPTVRSSITKTAIPGGWIDERITIAGHSFDLLRPSQPVEFLEQLVDVEDGEAEQDPYWAELWPAARQMAAFVLRHTWTPGTPALELGCGVGLVGLAALKAGLDVTFTDLQDLAVRTAVENAERNGFGSVLGRVLDWRKATDASWPLLLASDVLYERDLHQPLLDTLDALLAPGGVCWMGDPLRSAADSFIGMATSLGYDLKILPENPSRTSASGDRFRLLRLARKAASPEQDPISTIE